MRWGWMLIAIALGVSSAHAEPAPLADNGHYAFIPDPRYTWHGPEAARGIIVWGHGLDGNRKDLRGQKPPEFLRSLNESGYDIVRYDRDPSWDGNSRIPDVVEFLRQGLIEMRARGWKQIVAAGQSRGGINALSILKFPGVADVVLTTSAAMAGTDAGQVAMRGEVNFYEMLHDTPKQTTRVMFVQFLDDPFAGDEDKRVRRLHEWLDPQVGTLLVLDRPEGFHGHSAGASAGFAEAYGACVKRFVMETVPPKSC